MDRGSDTRKFYMIAAIYMKYKLELEEEISYESWQLSVSPLLLENWVFIQEIYEVNYGEQLHTLVDQGDNIKHTSSYMYKTLRDERYSYDYQQWDKYINKSYFKWR